MYFNCCEFTYVELLRLMDVSYGTSCLARLHGVYALARHDAEACFGRFHVIKINQLDLG